MSSANHFATLQQRLTREVWIITATYAGQRSGLTATWVSPASLDPAQPLLLAALSVNHVTTELVRSSQAFVAHLLRPDQVDVAWNFARDNGRERDKFAGLEVDDAANADDAPRLSDCLATVDCRVLTSHLAGDRLLVWGEALETRIHSDQMPLTDKELIAQLSDEQKQHLSRRRQADIDEQLTAHVRWRVESAGRSH